MSLSPIHCDCGPQWEPNREVQPNLYVLSTDAALAQLSTIPKAIVTMLPTAVDKNEASASFRAFKKSRIPGRMKLVPHAATKPGIKYARTSPSSSLSLSKTTFSFVGGSHAAKNQALERVESIILLGDGGLWARGKQHFYLSPGSLSA